MTEMTSMPEVELFVPITCEPMYAPITTWAEQAAEMPAIEWLWTNWLPRGFVTMLSGETGKGKSALALRIAMSVILRREWPDGSPVREEPGLVLWCESEAAQAINFRRAKDWGGDALLRGLVSPSQELFCETRLDRQEDLQRMEALAHDPRIRLVVVDSLSGSHRSDENAVEAGALVKQLAQIAQASHKPVLLTHHLRKRGTSEGSEVTLDRVRGSTALVQFTRLVWALDAPNSAQPQSLRLSVIKSNLGEYPPPLGMTIAGSGVTFSNNAPESIERVTALSEAEQFLNEMLGDGQKVPSQTMTARAEQRRIHKRTLFRAKTNLGVRAIRDSDQWYWTLEGVE